ncbi:MAG TPA: hypothetical protein VH637_14465 [Streptosporangiaceae bacterium]
MIPTPNAVTADYLADITRLGRPADALIGVAHRYFDLSKTTYAGRCLTRPVFLDHAQFSRLSRDLACLDAALSSLPGRLFGGDLAAFARAAGMTGAQVTAIMRTPSAAPTALARADFYPDETGFRLIEINKGSAIAGLDTALLNSAFLTDPRFAEFASSQGLAHVDTMAAMVATLRSECGLPGDDRLLVAAADWPASFPNLEPRLRYSAQLLAGYGLDVVPCHLGQVSVRDGRVWVTGQDRPVDVIYRLFMVEDLLQPEAAALVDPVLRAAQDGAVRIFAPLDAELYGSKAALALLSDEANRGLFTPAELESLDAILPWTRMVRPGPVTVDGHQADLREYALAQREDLILKPTLLHGGIGVVPGWLATPQDWAARLDAAMHGPHVLQRRIRPRPEPFPADGGLEAWVLQWGIILGSEGYSGVIARGSTDPDVGLVSMPSGATGTCCFFQDGQRAAAA